MGGTSRPLLRNPKLLCNQGVPAGRLFCAPLRTCFRKAGTSFPTPSAQPCSIILATIHGFRRLLLRFGVWRCGSDFGLAHGAPVGRSCGLASLFLPMVLP